MPQVVGGNTFQIDDRGTTTAQAGGQVTFGVAYAGVNGPVTLRFYGLNAEAAGGTFSLNNVRIIGAVH